LLLMVMKESIVIRRRSIIDEMIKHSGHVHSTPRKRTTSTCTLQAMMLLRVFRLLSRCQVQESLRCRKLGFVYHHCGHGRQLAICLGLVVDSVCFMYRRHSECVVGFVSDAHYCISQGKD